MIDAEMYGASGVMKVFLFDPISRDVQFFDALPRPAWAAPGVLELVCAAGRVGPAAFPGGRGSRRRPPRPRRPRASCSSRSRGRNVRQDAKDAKGNAKGG